MFKLTAYYSRARLIAPPLAAFCLLLHTFYFLPSASADSGQKLAVNQINSDNWPSVTLNLSLSGPDGKAIPGVTVQQFAVKEAGQPQTIERLQTGPAKDVAVSVVLAMDVSGSMNAANKLPQAKDAAKTFLQSLRPQDTASILAFNDKVTEVVKVSNDQAVLQAGIDSLQGGGNTAIYDALYKSAQVVSTMNANKRRVIILLTDGEDTSSKYAAAVASDAAKGTGALVYAIGLGPDANDGALRNLAEPSGGKYYKAPGPADLKAIYDTIALELNSQLFLTYHSATHTERSYQIVHVEVTWTGPDGQTLARIVTYRPPAAAVVAPTQEPVVLTPFPASLVVALPPGLREQPHEEAPTTKPTSFPITIVSLGAIVLASVAAAMAVLGLVVLLMPSATANRVQLYVSRMPAAIDDQRRRPNLFARYLLPMLENGGRRLARLSPKNYTDLISNMIVLLGPPYRLTVGAFLGVQLVLSALSLSVMTLIVAGSDSPAPAQWMLGALVALGVGAYLPFLWLKRRVTRRKKAILRSLPGALDFLAINVEAGLGFDAALGQVVKRWQNTLTDEFALLLVDFRIGKPRKDAWKDLVKRTQVPELNSFVTAMLQNEQVGISISTLLRTQADQLRVRRRQTAEELARTAPVKMLLPMVFFVFPGIFVIILGPAIPQFLGTFTQVGK